MGFEQKSVIVTGAGNGIGKAVAAMYAENGAKVALADIDAKAGAAAAAKLREQGCDVIFIPADVRLEDDIIEMMAAVKKAFGQIDILINNAGKGLFKSPYDVSAAEWDDLIATNLRSVFLASREAAKIMRENSEGGAIVNIASTRAVMSEPHSEAYAASKGGIVGVTHALAASFAPDKITVNAISPGWIETGDYSQLRSIDHDQHFSRRVGEPGDIGRACLYLTDPANRFVNGVNLVVDGGMTRKMIYED